MHASDNGGDLTWLSHEVETRWLALGLKLRLDTESPGAGVTCNRQRKHHPVKSNPGDFSFFTRQGGCRSARTHLDGTTARLTGDMNFPPWPEGLPGTMALLALVQEAGRDLGLSLKGIPTGGGSDGNHASAVAPTLDGFGPQGSLAHAPEEYIEVSTLTERARVTARFIELWTEKFRPTS